jgi:hypothetical protein
MTTQPPSSVTVRYVHREACCNSRKAVEIAVPVDLDTDSLVLPHPPVCVHVLPALVELAFIGTMPTYPRWS